MTIIPNHKKIQKIANWIFNQILLLALGVPIGFMLALFFFATVGQFFGDKPVINIFEIIDPISIAVFGITGRAFLAWS